MEKKADLIKSNGKDLAKRSFALIMMNLRRMI